MLVGLVIGILLFNYIHGDLLRIVFGIFVVCISSFQLITRGLIQRQTLSLPPWKSRFLILCGGVIQGLYASGGPLLVFVASRLGLSKSAFRSTVSALFLTLNILLIISFTATGRISILTLIYILLLIPLLAVSMMIGERLHRHINEHQFTICIYALLLMAGVSILLF